MSCDSIRLNPANSFDGTSRRGRDRRGTVNAPLWRNSHTVRSLTCGGLGQEVRYSVA
jgi:hypothetical protein